MFQSDFSNKFILVGKERKADYIEWKYSFECTKTHNRFIVLVHQFDWDVFILKFYLKQHRHSVNRFKLLTNLGNTTRVLRTCIDILLSIYLTHSRASFGFIGESSIGEEDTVRFKNEFINKRFSLYRRLVINIFDESVFSHRQYTKENAYILLNKSNDTPNLLLKVEALFEKHYSLLSE